MKKRRVRKWVYVVFIVLVMMVGSAIGIKQYFEMKEDKRLKEEEKVIADISSHYGEIVKVSKESTLYEEKDGEFVAIGSVAADECFSLEKMEIGAETKYFKIKELGYFIKYEDVVVSDSLGVKDERYKNYLLFNENVLTKENVRLYRGDKVVYTLGSSLEIPIIIKDDAGYYVEYFGELLFIKNEDVVKTYEANNTTLEEASGIPVTVYHFIYLNGDTSCNEAICHSENQIREHFNYLKTHEFFTMNTTELRLYLEGKLRVPKKSILITIDDGSRAWNFIPLLEEYQVNATLFLISGWYTLDKFQSPYMEVASHTHNLHTPGVCSGGQGSPLKCYDRTKLVADLKTSREVLGGTEAFCFPFYEYNDYGISALKEAGFKMAFIGGYRKATRGVDLFKIPRIPLTDYTTLAQYANYIN